MISSVSRVWLEGCLYFWTSELHCCILSKSWNSLIIVIHTRTTSLHVCVIAFTTRHWRMKAPRYRAVKPTSGPVQRMVIKPEVSLWSWEKYIEPYFCGLSPKILITVSLRDQAFHYCVDEMHRFLRKRFIAFDLQTAQVRPIGLAAVLRNITFTRVSKSTTSTMCVVHETNLGIEHYSVSIGYTLRCR